MMLDLFGNKLRKRIRIDEDKLESIATDLEARLMTEIIKQFNVTREERYVLRSYVIAGIMANLQRTLNTLEIDPNDFDLIDERKKR